MSVCVRALCQVKENKCVNPGLKERAVCMQDVPQA